MGALVKKEAIHPNFGNFKNNSFEITQFKKLCQRIN